MNQPSILVVDDAPINFDIIESLLNDQQYDLHYASSGKEALESLELINLDLILLDVMMPDMDGIEVCCRIKATPQWQEIPIIMVTALTAKEDLDQCLKAGADDFISKPVSRVELRARIHSMLRIKQHYDDLQASLKLREDMVNMLVHDLRNPLASILLGLETLDKFNLSAEKQKDKLYRIRESAQKLQILIDDLLLMARIQSGKMSLNTTLIDINHIISSVVEEFQVIASSKNIELITKLPELSCMINIDTAMCQRMLDNLLANAIKFAPRKSQVIIYADYLTSEGVKICISDFGKGVPEQLKQSIFKRYEIGTPMQGISQIGLGLAFCKMVIEAHGGNICVKNNQPSGAIFEITLPEGNINT